MIYQCSACGEVFEKDGLELIVHERCVVRICPGCLSGKSKVQVTIGKERPGKPFKFQLLLTEEDVYEVKEVKK